MERRAAAGGHFTPGTALLDSQLAALEYRQDELWMHVRGRWPSRAVYPPPGRIAEAAAEQLQLLAQPLLPAAGS